LPRARSAARVKAVAVLQGRKRTHAMATVITTTSNRVWSALSERPESVAGGHGVALRRVVVHLGDFPAASANPAIVVHPGNSSNQFAFSVRREATGREISCSVLHGEFDKNEF